MAARNEYFDLQPLRDQSADGTPRIGVTVMTDPALVGKKLAQIESG